MTSSGYPKNDLPNDGWSVNSNGDDEVTAPLLSSLFMLPAHILPVKRGPGGGSEDKGYIQVGTTNAGNKIRRVIHQHGQQPQHPSPRSCRTSIMLNDYSNIHESNSKPEMEQQLNDAEGEEKERKGAGVGRALVSPECALEIEHGNTNPVISDRSAKNASRSQSPVTSSKRKCIYPRLVASEIPVQSTAPDGSPNPDPLAAKVWEVLSAQSYPTEKIRSMGQTSKYYSTPSPLQKASFGNAVVKAVHSRDATKLKSLLLAGLSRNPCNSFGESILNTICKRGHEEMFRTVMNCGGSIHTTDAFGRTPLHYAMWCPQPCFSIVECLLEKDADMIRVVDKLGKTPLEYASKKKTDEWVSYFITNQGKFWCRDNNTQIRIGSDGSCHNKEGDTLPDPPGCLSREVARQVSCGEIESGEIDYFLNDAYTR